MTTAYPLSWPEGWPRRRAWKSDRQFVGRQYGLSVSRAARQLDAELHLLGAKEIVISTNLKVTLGSGATDGRGSNVSDTGAAIYFLYQQQQMVMAQDIFDSVAGNLRSLCLAMEAMRQLERHGGGHMMKRAFAGFAQLPPPAGAQPEHVNWQAELGVENLPQSSIPARDLLAICESRYREKAKTAHADTGGDHTAMIRLNAAIAQARQELG